jgi:uncharacterized protein (DUF983 family)
MPTSPQSWLTVGLKGRCPRCGQGALFRSGLVVRESCSSCGLDYSFVMSGDGPAVFAIFILGAGMLGAAMVAEFKFHVSVWFHVVAWGLLTPLFAFGILRLLKGLLIAQQYRTKAAEGRIAKL